MGESSSKLENISLIGLGRMVKDIDSRLKHLDNNMKSLNNEMNNLIEDREDIIIEISKRLDNRSELDDLKQVLKRSVK